MIPFNNVLELIGNTPMIDVTVLSPNPGVRIVAKLESQNPFGSVKDRIAKQMILQAERDGRSEERRVGKECRTVCRSRWSPDH